ncbi:hypothetical protein DIZ27_44060 [Streptomyces sp. NWU339]|nr:hypothetical protein DIZ27_44060 [Streptomyces sp. NWU339]
MGVLEPVAGRPESAFWSGTPAPASTRSPPAAPPPARPPAGGAGRGPLPPALDGRPPSRGLSLLVGGV